MATFQEETFNDRDDDFRNQNNVSTANDDLGENTEQTPLADAVSKDRQQGWENNKPGTTTDNENDQRIPTVTPDNENGTPGPGEHTQHNLIDDNRINGAMSPQDAGISADSAPDPDEWDDADNDDDLVDDDDDELLTDDDDDDELIPIEGDDDDDDELDLDDDDEEDDDLDTDHRPSLDVDADFASRPHGRTTGTMTDHEPGLPGGI